jgi:hypothetical protein
MSFEAYIRNIHAKTGKLPKDFFKEATTSGVLRPGTRTMEFVKWLKGSSGLGHGHAMAIWEAFRRNGWVAEAPVARARPPRRRTRN